MPLNPSGELQSISLNWALDLLAPGDYEACWCVIYLLLPDPDERVKWLWIVTSELDTIRSACEVWTLLQLQPQDIY